MTYVLVPRRITKRNLFTKGLERFRLFVSVRNLLLGSGDGLGRRLGHRLSLGRGLRFCVERADLELGLVLLEDALVVVFPELLGGVLASYTLKDLLAAGVIILELGQVVDVAVDNDVEVVGLVVRSNVADSKCLGHDGL